MQQHKNSFNNKNNSIDNEHITDKNQVVNKESKESELMDKSIELEQSIKSKHQNSSQQKDSAKEENAIVTLSSSQDQSKNTDSKTENSKKEDKSIQKVITSEEDKQEWKTKTYKYWFEYAQKSLFNDTNRFWQLKSLSNFILVAILFFGSYTIFIANTTTVRRLILLIIIAVVIRFWYNNIQTIKSTTEANTQDIDYTKILSSGEIDEQLTEPEYWKNQLQNIATKHNSIKKELSNLNELTNKFALYVIGFMIISIIFIVFPVIDINLSL